MKIQTTLGFRRDLFLVYRMYWQSETDPVKRREYFVRLEEVAMSLAENAILVELERSSWTGVVEDKEISAGVTASKGIDGKYKKELFTQDVRGPLDKAHNAMDRLYVEFQRLTFPWKRRGQSAVLAPVYLEFMKVIGNLKGEAESAIQNFVDAYPSMVETMKTKKGYADYPYPSQEEVRAKFGISLRFEPIADSKDIRVKLQEEDIERIREEVRAQEQKFVRDSVEALWERLKTAMESSLRNLNVLPGGGSAYRSNWYHNLNDLYNLILPMNQALKDEELDKIAKDIKENLLDKFEVDELKHDLDARKDAKETAQSIMDKMAAAGIK